MFTKDLMLLLDKIQNELMIPDKELSYTYAIGVDEISYGCNSSCGGDCENSCSGDCDYSCTGDCESSCETQCYGWGL